MKTDEELTELFQNLSSDLRKVTVSVMGALENASEEELRNVAEIWFTVLVRECGYLDTLTALAGVTSDERSEIRIAMMHEGSLSAIEDHDQECSGCEAGQAVRQELNGN